MSHKIAQSNSFWVKIHIKKEKNYEKRKNIGMRGEERRTRLTNEVDEGLL
jgi:hypothetical protein